MTPAYAMLPTITVCVAGIEFTVGTPDLKVFGLLLLAALLNAGVRAILPNKRKAVA